MTQWEPPYDPRRQRPATPPQWQQGPPQYQQPQQPPQPQYQPGPQQPPYPQYQPPPRPRQSRKGLAFLGCGGLGALVVLIAALASSSSPSSSAGAGTQTQAAAPANSPASAEPAAAKTVATFTGSGTQKTAQFTVTSTWKLVYSFDCASFGYKGNFQVFEDGGSDLSGVTVNDLAMSKSSSSYAYDDAGTHYLEVNSECSWSVKVIDEG